ncbi:hypothetical protein TKK_0007366 [Trichogramma kaykai]|uniref:General transcription factor IIH subunit 3 n=1 Tax=Trichogramma kaykai TaxID=54128 RepID=A0ABD2WGQ7_9HYME
MATDIEKSLLIIVLDINPMQKLIKQVITQVLSSTIVFANAHLMQRSNNILAFMSCHDHGAEFLYPKDDMPGVRQYDGQYEKFSQLEHTVRKQIHKIVGEMPMKHSNETLISGALSMGLCYITRLEREKYAGEKINSRMIVITGSVDSATQYMHYMNIFFTAQKMGIILDVCSLEHELTLLQQGCDLTGGNYLKLPQNNGKPNIPGLLQYLMWIFLPDPAIRSKLVLPPPVKVDYRAACFCHQELIDTGYVCSVCLSIFCKIRPICTTCHTMFKFAVPLAHKPKKRKKAIDMVQ